MPFNRRRGARTHDGCFASQFLFPTQARHTATIELTVKTLSSHLITLERIIQFSRRFKFFADARPQRAARSARRFIQLRRWTGPFAVTEMVGPKRSSRGIDE
eukprot:1195487-Prorocentrum_minimum.AAC.4